MSIGAAAVCKINTSPDEMTSNCEEIKPIALVVIKLCLSEGVSQLVNQSVR